MPSTGRNPFLFSTTLPNVIPIGTPFFTRMQDQNASSLLSIAGAPPRANTYLLDGVPITDLLNRAAMVPSNEALEEVSVQINTYDSSFGRSGGGVTRRSFADGTISTSRRVRSMLSWPNWFETPTADFLVNGVIRPNTQELLPVTLDNLEEARADFESIMNG